MGIYLNPSSIGFKRSLNSEIYVDKTGLIEKTNALLDTEQKFICVSRPRRFGKSMAVNMLSAYDEAAGLKSLDIPSLLSVVGLVLHQFDTTYEQNGFTESKELSVWDSSFFRILFMKKFQAKALLSLIKR